LRNRKLIDAIELQVVIRRRYIIAPLDLCEAFLRIALDETTASQRQLLCKFRLSFLDPLLSMQEQNPANLLVGRRCLTGHTRKGFMLDHDVVPRDQSAPFLMAHLR
jgi:hypothetical protein